MRRLGFLTLRIRENVPSNRLFSRRRLHYSVFDKITVEAGVPLVCGDLSGAGCGGGAPRIAKFRN